MTCARFNRRWDNNTAIDNLNAHYVFAYYNSNNQMFYLYNSEGSYTSAFDTPSIDTWLRNREFVRMGVITFK